MVPAGGSTGLPPLGTIAAVADDSRWADDMPAAYDEHLGPALFRPYGEHLAARAAALAPRDVLEVAAGTGIVTRGLVRALPDARVTATDLNPPMVRWAEQQVPDATWRVADAQDLPFPDAAFDLVLCQFGVMFFPDRPRAYGEMARVLRPGGSVLLAVWDVVSGSLFAAALVRALDAVLPDGAPDFVVRVPYGYADPAQQQADAAAAGLQVTEHERVVREGSAASARSLAEGFCLGTPLRFALAEHGDLPALVDGVADALTAELGPGPLTGELAAWVLTAQRDRR